MKIAAEHFQHEAPEALPTFTLVDIEKPISTVVSLQSELRWLLVVLRILLYVDLVVAIACFGFSIHNSAAISLISNGLLAVLAAITILLTTIQMRTNKNWNEICIMTLCSVYAPFFVLWVASGNLLCILVSKI